MTRIAAKVTALVGIVFMLLIVASSARAEDVDEEIKALKEKLTTLENKQIEMRKEATAAAAAFPTFSYRPGNGVMIEAADKSWAFRTSVEMHFRYNFLSGRDQVGRSQGEMEGRRFRPEFWYCLNNCLWEFEAALDLDGAGGGNAKNQVGDPGGSILQRGAVNLHADQLHPWLPMVQFGMEVQNAHGGSRARQGSGATGAQAEYDLHTANDGFNTGRAGSGMVFNWDDRSLSGIGIPGRISRFQVGMSAIAEGDDGGISFTDRKDFNAYLSVQPFSQLKNKWIQGLLFEYGSWFCNHDNRANDNGCSRYRIRDNSRLGRQTLYDTGSDSIGDGLHRAHGPGIVWNVGPYTMRVMGSFQQSADRGGTRGKKSAHSFLIGHDLFLWSPKGFLTGSATTTNSILVGTHFERVDMSCTTAALCAGINGGQYHRERVMLREWDLWYFIAPRMSVGTSVLWYDASNLRSTRNQAAHNLGICSSGDIAGGNCRPGIGGDWVDVFLNWRYQF
jgi:hypothetical protein